MSAPRVHVIGAGMAGLAASVNLAKAGYAVSLYEAAPQAGGRCRSYHDAALGCRIDNGNHLLIAGNKSAMAYLDVIGARGSFTGPDAPDYPFLDRGNGERWTLRMNKGRVPWWMAWHARRVSGTTLLDYLGARKLFDAAPDAAVDDVLDPATTIYRRLWQPLAIAALNTPLDQASARLLAHVLAESVGAGGAACTPLIPREGLSESLVEPALAYLRQRGAMIRFGARLRAIGFTDDAATSLDFEGEVIAVTPGDRVVLAVNAPVATRLIPGIEVPEVYHAIVNAHFRVDAPANAPFFVGVIGGTAEWVFRKPGVLSVTVSAADRLVDTPNDQLAATLWDDVTAAYGLAKGPVPPVQIVKERRATFASSPAQLRRRPGAATRWSNLALAGDWTATGLPATIEGAIRSAFTAASYILDGAAATQKSLSGDGSLAKVAPHARSLAPQTSN